MSENKRSSASGLLSAILGFIIGTFIGLVVLGWWLWPVKWEGGVGQQMTTAAQQDYLRAAIDSFSLNKDEVLARQRYQYFGVDGLMLLNSISQESGENSAQDIQLFASAVGVTLPQVKGTTSGASGPSVPSIAVPQTPKEYRWFSNRPLMIAFGLIALGALFLFLLILFLAVRRRGSRSKIGSAPTIQTFDTPDQSVEILESGAVENAQPGELPDWLQLPSDQELVDEKSTTFESESHELSEADFVELSASTASMENEGAMFAAPDFAISEPPVSEMKSVQHAAQLEAIEPASPSLETPEQTYTKFSLDIQFLPDINLDQANSLRSNGLSALLLLFKAGASPEGRVKIAEQTGLDPEQILRWVNAIDLLRVKGLSQDDLQVLKAAGVDMIVELATRDPEALFQKIITEGEGVFPELPSLTMVNSWVEQAKRLPRVVTY